LPASYSVCATTSLGAGGLEALQQPLDRGQPAERRVVHRAPRPPLFDEKAKPTADRADPAGHPKNARQIVRHPAAAFAFLYVQPAEKLTGDIEAARAAD